MKTRIKLTWDNDERVWNGRVNDKTFSLCRRGVLSILMRLFPEAKALKVLHVTISTKKPLNDGRFVNCWLRNGGISLAGLFEDFNYGTELAVDSLELPREIWIRIY